MAITQSAIRLLPAGVVLQVMPQLKHRVVADFQLSSECGRWLTFDKSPHQQHDLPECQMPLLKDRSAVQVIGLTTFITPIRLQLAPASLPKRMRSFSFCSTVRTVKSLWMKVTDYPFFTGVGIE
jgi:hypothetical protein